MIDNTKYIYWIWPDFFVDDELSQLQKHLKNINMKGEPSEDPAPGKKFTNSYVFRYENISYLPSITRLHKNIPYINQYHFGYDIYNLNEIDEVLLNKYSSEQKHHYDWHIDQHDSHMLDFKFTVLANISNNYTGGEFELNANGNPFTVNEFKPGAVIMFRSNVQHKVNPVLSGSRETLSFFIRGPRWR